MHPQASRAGIEGTLLKVCEGKVCPALETVRAGGGSQSSLQALLDPVQRSTDGRAIPCQHHNAAISDLVQGLWAPQAQQVPPTALLLHAALAVGPAVTCLPCSAERQACAGHHGVCGGHVVCHLCT